MYQTGEGRFYGPPPFASVLFSPLAMLSTMQARIIFIAINLIATAIIILLIKKLWGEAWPVKTHLYLAALLLCWAPFRVTVRYGQISLIVTALRAGGIARVEKERQACRGPSVGIVALQVSADASIRAVLCLAQGVEDRGHGGADGGGADRSICVEAWRVDVRRCGRLCSNDDPHCRSPTTRTSRAQLRSGRCCSG